MTYHRLLDLGELHWITSYKYPYTPYIFRSVGLAQFLLFVLIPS